MTLISCPDCKNEISSEANSCPRCGYSLAKGKDKKSSSGCSTGCLGIVLISVIIVIIGPLCYFGSDNSISSSSSRSSYSPVDSSRANLQAVEIVDWNWKKDPSFGTGGTIKWNVQVRNISNKYIESVRVDFTTYDAGGQLVATTFTFVDAIPPGETRSVQSYADLYGTETRSTVQIVNVWFAR